MQLLLIFTVLGFCLAGWYDYKEKTIPDLLTALIWLLSYQRMEIAGLAFAALFFVNSLLYTLNAKFIVFGWGDILIMPCYIALVGPGSVLVYLIFGAGALSCITKKKEAVGPFLALGALIQLLSICL
jgi:hypothetical protein